MKKNNSISTCYKHIYWINRLFIVFVFVFFITITSCIKSETEDEKLAKIGKIIDDTWMEVTLGKTTYRVQKAYVRGAGKNYKRIQDSLYLRAYMPDFRKRSTVLQANGAVSLEDQFNDIDFTISYQPETNFKLNYQATNPMAFRLNKNLPMDEILAEKYIRKEYSLEYFGIFHEDDLYIFRENYDPRGLFFCNLMIKDTIPSCTAWLNYGYKVRIRTHFKRQFLPSWPFIWQKLNEIIYIKEK